MIKKKQLEYQKYSSILLFLGKSKVNGKENQNTKKKWAFFQLYD